MRGIVTWFVNNSVPANLFMFFLIVGGFFISYPSIKAEFFPTPDPKVITIVVPYPGASASEVEASISSKIEDRLEGVSGIKKISSNSLEGRGVVGVRIFASADFDNTFEEIKTIVDGITTFPENSEEPIVKKLEITEKVLDVVVHGDVDENVLLSVTKSINEEIKNLSEVSFTEIYGNRNREISIEISENNLEKYNLTFDEIAFAINMGSIDLPGGVISSTKGDLLIRTVGQSYKGNEFENIVIRTNANGSTLLLKDIAIIKDTFEEVDKFFKWNGTSAMFISANLVGNQDVLTAANQLRNFVKNKKNDMPENIQIDYWYDQARFLEDRINILYKNFAIGMCLVLILLTMFLRPSVAFWVAMGIPISFGGALLLLPMLGVTINVLSTFMFIVVLGIVVDDAIIVGENVFRRRIKLNEDNFTSTIKGTMEVMLPVFFGILTTIVVFAPMLDLAGDTGPIWRTFPLTAIPILVFSLIESTTILPAHLNHAGEWFQYRFVKFGKMLSILRNYFSEKLYQFIDNSWLPLVKNRNAVLIAPEFSKESYPEYVYLMMSTERGKLLKDQSLYLTDSLGLFFDYFKAKLKLSTSTFRLYGHSGGSQFVHRYLLLSDESRIEKAAMANAGFYTFADDQISYPFGIKNMNVSNERLEWFLRLKGGVFLGDADNDPKHHSLPTMRKAKKQGKHRFERGTNFFNSLIKLGVENNLPFRWRYQTVPGIAHDNAGMSLAASEFLLEDL